MKFYFVRHGESEANVIREISNRPGRHPLTPTGRQQAATLAGGLKRRFDSSGTARIFTSPLLRAVQTAEILGQAFAAPVEITDALREYDMGVMEGRADALAWEAWIELRRQWFDQGLLDQKIEGGESFTEIKARFLPFIQHLRSTYRDQAVNLILVSHGGLYSCMLPLVLANLPADVHQRPIENTAYILAEERPAGLVCLEWCGQNLEAA